MKTEYSITDMPFDHPERDKVIEVAEQAHQQFIDLTLKLLNIQKFGYPITSFKVEVDKLQWSVTAWCPSLEGGIIDDLYKTGGGYSIAIDGDKRRDEEIRLYWSGFTQKGVWHTMISTMVETNKIDLRKNK